MFKGIAYLVIAVNDVEQALKDYETNLGLKARDVAKENPDAGIRSVILPLGDSGAFIEVAEPLGPETPVGRTLERRGEGLHSVAIAVDDLQQTVSQLKEKGAQVIEAGSTTAVRASTAFVHPRGTHGIMFQLVERK